MPTTEHRTSLKSVLLRVAVLGAGSAFVIINVGPIASGLGGLTGTNLALVIVGVALSVVAMTNRGLLNHAAHRSVGLTPTPTAMTRTTAIGFAANKIVKSGGASGLAVFLRHGRANGFAGASVAASCVIASVASLAALGISLAVTVALLALRGDLTGWWLAAGSGFAAYGVVLVVLGRCASANKRTMTRLWATAQRLRNRLSRQRREIDVSCVEELYAAMNIARTRVLWTRRALVHAVASKALGAAMLLAAATAAGISLSPTGAVIIYTTALAASFVSIVPAGVGVVEASTGAMFVAAGAPVPAAVVAVALYRIFDLWLPVATGAFLGRRELRRMTPPAAAAEPVANRAPSQLAVA